MTELSALSVKHVRYDNDHCAHDGEETDDEVGNVCGSVVDAPTLKQHRLGAGEDHRHRLGGDEALFTADADSPSRRRHLEAGTKASRRTQGRQKI